MIGYSLAKSLAITLEFVRSSSSTHIQKIARINAMISEMEQELASGKSENQRKGIEDTIKRFREERENFIQERLKNQEKKRESMSTLSSGDSSEFLSDYLRTTFYQDLKQQYKS